MTKLRFRSLRGLQQNFVLLDLIPDTHAWVKDTRGRFVFGNRLFCRRFGLSSPEGLAGKNDYDIAPAHMAADYRRDDEQVLEGAVIADRLEMISAEDGAVAWFLTCKWPVHDLRDRIIGSFGISRHLNDSERDVLPYRELRAPIDYISRHFASAIPVESLAKACNLSVSALERRFRKHLKKTPHQYLTEVRLDRARLLLLETDKPVGVIALETGFSDHSHFTRSYTRRFGLAPSRARRAARGS